MATITKITNKSGIKYRVQIRKFKQGRIIHSEARTFSKYTLADKWGKKRESELDQPGALDRVIMPPVEDLIDWYIRDFCATAGRTKAADLKTLKTYDFAKLPADQLTTEVLIAHIQKRNETVKPQTANNDLVWLRNVYKAAQPAWGIPVDSSHVDAAANFCRAKGLVCKSEERDRRPTADELVALDAHFASRDQRATIPMQDIMWFAIHSSRRETEITKLLRSDNNPEHRTGWVRNIKHPRKKNVNKKFKYTQKGWDIAQRQPINPDDPDRIFPYNPRSISAAFTRACHLLEIEDLHFHDLRHEATSRLFEAKYSIPQVQLFTLHESWAVLKRYVNLRHEDLD